MNQPRHEISVCICTFRRPALLARLLGELKAQHDDKLYALRVIVADNDDARSALPVVESAKPGLGLPVEYVHEPERNIALARNAAVAKASGDLVAFIDDDEFPAGDWLPSLVRCLDRMDVDGVLTDGRPGDQGTLNAKPATRTGVRSRRPVFHCVEDLRASSDTASARKRRSWKMPSGQISPIS